MKVLLAPFHAGQRVVFDENRRGTILPLLRDEPLTVELVENRGTKRKPEWFALVCSDRKISRFVECELLRALVK